MSGVAAKIELSPEETDELNRWIESGKTEQRKVERAKIVLRSAEGKPTYRRKVVALFALTRAGR
jgi:hypothetical protein